jgi:chaperone BCS1
MDHDLDMEMSGMVVGGKRTTTKSRSRVTLSGLLNVLDGVGSEEGKIFFATVCIFPQVFFDAENRYNTN